MFYKRDVIDFVKGKLPLAKQEEDISFQQGSDDRFHINRFHHMSGLYFQIVYEEFTGYVLIHGTYKMF